MAEFPILSLPTEIQALVVERVAHNSFVDLYRLRTTCKSMRALADRGRVYASFDLFKYPSNVCMPNLLLRRCFKEGNPSTLYIKGVEYFYRLDRQEEGLVLIKRAADAGLERALYTYAMTLKIFSDDGVYFSRLRRKTVGKIGNVVRCEDGGWFWNHNNAFLIKRHVFMSTVVPLLYSCLCSPILDRDWDLWHIEKSKADEEMCERCFWIKEIALFVRDFKPCTGFPAFENWQ